MPRKRYSVEQIMAKLREAEVELSRGATTSELATGVYFYRFTTETMVRTLKIILLK